MIACTNCKKPALYSLTLPRVSPVHYCHRCLPAHLRKLADMGNMPLLDQGASAISGPVAAPTPTPVKKRRKAKTAPAATVVEPVAETDLAAAVEAGYKADAVDGDADGLVQDGTEFERPEGDILVSYSEEPTE